MSNMRGRDDLEETVNVFLRCLEVVKVLMSDELEGAVNDRLWVGGICDDLGI